MNKIYIPSKSQIIPILENYLTYSENSICYHYNNQQYKLLIPRKILQIYPLQIPNNSQFIIIIFTNGITLNRLQFQNNKLINSTLFSFSTIITSIDDISMKMIDGKISFAIRPRAIHQERSVVRENGGSFQFPGVADPVHFASAASTILPNFSQRS